MSNKEIAVYSAIRSALGPYAPDITATAFGEQILRNATTAAIAAMARNNRIQTGDSA